MKSAKRPGEELYQEAQARERAGDTTAAIALYRRAEKLGHPLTDLDEEDEEPENSFQLSIGSEPPPPGCTDCRQPLIVGLGGATRSGKTTLATALSAEEAFHVVCHIHQDHYYTTPTKMEKVQLMMEDGQVRQERNWEIPQSIMWFNFIQEILQQRERATVKCQRCSSDSFEGEADDRRRKVILVDGFLIYCHPLLMDHLLNKKIFLTISKEESYSRRMATATVPKEYFEQVIWPSYMEYAHERIAKPPTSEREDVLLLSGEDDADDILRAAVAFISK